MATQLLQIPKIDHQLDPLLVLELHYSWSIILKQEGMSSEKQFWLTSWTSTQLARHRGAHLAKPQYGAISSYPEVCKCLSIFSSTGSRLNNHCSYCLGNHSFLTHYSTFHDIPVFWQEVALARAIYNVHSRIPDIRTKLIRASRIP